MPPVCLVKSSSQYDILLQYIVLTVNDQLLCVVGVVVVVGVGGGGEKVAYTRTEC